MHNLSEEELTKVRLSRRALEVDVAKSIGKYLLNNQKGYIRKLTLTIIDRIFELPSILDGRFNVDDFLKKQTPFVMWRECNTNANLGLIALNEVRRYIEEDMLTGYKWLIVCSDVVRLFGEISEKEPVEMLKDPNWQIMAKKGLLRPNPVYMKPPKQRQDESDEAYKERVEENVEGFHRHRDDKPNEELHRVEAPFVPITDRDNVQWRGVEKFEFGMHSVIETIDWTYGLQIEGGDVSGTTTDSIAALRWASRTVGIVNPIAQLMAIATMIPQGHHTMVEAAWPLTRHGYMDYKIGFYETLVPAGLGYDDLRGVLESWNKDVRNKHVIVCKDMTRRLKLNLHFNKPDEIREYRKIAGVRDAYSFCVGGYPTIGSMENMMRAHGMTDLVVTRMYNWVGLTNA